MKSESEATAKRMRATGEGRLSATATEASKCPSAKLTKCPIQRAIVQYVSSRPRASRIHHPASPPSRQCKAKRKRKRATGEGRLSAIADEAYECQTDQVSHSTSDCPLSQQSPTKPSSITRGITSTSTETEWGVAETPCLRVESTTARRVSARGNTK